MNDIIRTYQERFRSSRHAFRRYTALLLALAMITTLFVNWQLHGVGISMTADYQCGEIEHTHTAGCYTKVLVCGYEEGELENPDEVAAAGSNDTTIDTGSSDFAVYEAPEPQIEWVPHEHTADCYTDVEVLTCMEEEHVHDDDCFDPEDGSLICDKFEHTHDESCYTTEQELTCGLEEGELVEQEVEPTWSAALFELAVAEPVAVELPADTVEPIYHHHTDACYEEELTCPFPEHHHTVNCLSDPYADVETEDDWLAKTDTTLDGLWSDDLLTVAQSQLGYEQSEKNFQLDGDDQSTVRYYTRYGDAYGNKYGEWDVMFLAYCLKYAQIPQTAVPQKAGVLALRSAMKDMDWFQDVDSAETAALDLVPGDIVLYKKAATRTVAVDTTQPDTVQPDTTTSIRGSHDSLISVLPADSSTAEPVDVGDFSPVLPTEPTTMTTTEWVDTVGIVEEVDAEAGTLTVIAGDVDGKVAEVPLSMGDIESMISLTAAQVALSGDGGAAVQPGANSTTVSYKSYFTETPEGTNKGGVYDYTISVDNIDYKDGLVLTEGKTVNLGFKYRIESGVLSKDNKVLHYKLPEGLEPSSPVTKDIYDKKGDKIGTQVFNTDGTTTLTFDPNSGFDFTKQFEGEFAYDWEYTKTTTSKVDKIVFPGSSTTITLKKQQELNVHKTASDIEETNDGKLIIHYTITVDTPTGWDEDNIYIDDLFKETNSSTLTTNFTNFVLKKYTSDSDTTGTNYEGFTAPTVTKDQYNPYYKFKIENLKDLKAGEKYVLTYDVELTNTSGQGWQEFNNEATINEGKKSEYTTKHNLDHLKKTGTYDKDTGKITWTVTVYNPNGADLNGDIITDTIKTAGSTVEGNVKLYMVKDENGNDVPENQQLLKEFAPGRTDGFTYTFDNKAINTKGREYKFVYTSTVPEGATSVANGAKYDRGTQSDYTAGTTVDITDNKWSPKKTTNATELVKCTEELYQDLYEMAWKIDADMPRSIKTVTIKDKIDQGYTASNDLGRMNQFGYAKYLDDQIKANLTITCTDTDGTEKTLTYSELLNKGVKFTIKYYQGTDANGNQVAADNAPDNTTKKVQSFTIDIDTTDCSLKLVHLSLPYKTLVDISGLKEGGRVNIKNTANDSSADFSYTKPTTSVRIAKGAWQSNVSREQLGSYGGTNSDTTMNYDKNLIIGYQVVLDLSALDELDEMTLTDILPVGTKYVKDTTSVVFGKSTGLNNGSQGTKPKPATTDGSVYDLFQHYDFFEPTETPSTDPEKVGDTLTFQWNWPETKIDFAKLKQEGYTYLALRYKVSIAEDTRWDDLKKDQNIYKNHISYGAGDKISADATTKVNRNTAVLSKGSAQIKTKANESRVHYTVVINPAGKTLGNIGKLTLNDTLTVQSLNVRAELDMSSVKLYNYPKEKYPDALDPTTYEFTAPVQGQNSSGQLTYTMSLTVADSTPYVLEYEYVTDARADVRLRNDAKLSTSQQSSTEQTYEKVGGSSKAYQDSLTIHKVDSRNDQIALPGAKFRLEVFDNTTGTWSNVKADHSNYTTVENDTDNGTLTFYFTKTSVNDNDLSTGKLYRLTEEVAPTDYQKRTQPYYFIYRNATDTTSDDAAYAEALGNYANNGAGDSSVSAPAKNDPDLKFYNSTSKANDLYVRNVADNLVINKTWLDEKSYPVNGKDAPLDEITVDLYKCLESSTPDPATDTKVTTITLYKTKGWTYKYTGLETGYRYYIVEQYSGTRFEVTYSSSENNNSSVGPGGVLTVTNKDTGQKEYELPSTGGTGTLPFTVAGGAMMLAALVYGIRRKRRYEGRAD